MAEFSTHGTGGGLTVLGTDGVGDIIGGDVQSRKLHRVDPDTHGVVTLTHDTHFTDTVNTGQGVTDVGADVVGKLSLAQLAAVGGEVVECQNIAGTFEVLHTVILDHLGQQRLRPADGILNVHQSNIGVGSGLEGDVQDVKTCVT